MKSERLDETESSNGGENIKSLEIDEILELIGPFNKCQIVLSVMFFIMIIPSAYQVLVLSFTGHSPPWRCVKQRCNLTGMISVGDVLYDKRCAMRRKDWEFVTDASYSIVTEWMLICDKKMYSYFASSATFIGWAIGAVVLGIISDMYGRKSVLFPSMGTILLAGFASAFVNNFWLFFILRLIIGFCEGGIVLTLFVIASEVVGPSYRSFSGTLIWFSFTAGFCLLALQAWLIPRWRTLTVVLTAPYVFVMFFYRCVPESMRWYRVNNMSDKAQAVLLRVSKINKKPWPDVHLSIPPKQVNRASYKDIFYPWSVGCSTLIQCSSWFVNGLVYFGISLASDNLGGNMYRDFVLTAIVELPANMLLVICTNSYGRKPSVIYGMMLGGIACLLVAWIPNQSPIAIYRWSRVGMGMLGKFSITLAFNSFYIWSVELFPTSVRSQGMGLVSVCSRVGAASAPWVAQWLSLYSDTLPFGVMGVLTLLSSVSLFSLKETLGLATAETIEPE